MSQLFACGGQSIGASVSASVLPMNTQDRSPFGWTGWISLQSKGLSRVFSNTIVLYTYSYIPSFGVSFPFKSPLLHSIGTEFPILHNRFSLRVLVAISSNHFILCCPLLLLPSIFPSIRVFSDEWAFQFRWPKYRSFSFSFSISPSNEYSGLISFRIDWFDHLAVQGTLKSLHARMSITVSQLIPLPPLSSLSTYIWSLALCFYFCLEVMALFLRKILNVLLTGNVAGRFIQIS